MNNKLIFEGAGWAKAENNGVGNCRIRSTFKNDSGDILYLEFNGIKTHKWSPSYMKIYNFPWHIAHIFNMKDEKTNYTKELSHLTKITKEYTKENILEFINTHLGCSFESIEVNNDDYDGFKTSDDQ